MNPNISTQVSDFKASLEGSKSVAITLAQNPSVDSVAAALSLYISLSMQGKQVSVICARPMTVEFNRLVGVDKITGNFGSGEGKNLVIAFPYEEGSIEKVSYNIDNGYFNLVIEPREGYPLITQDSLRYTLAGGTTDLIVTVGVASPEMLGEIYQANENLFQEKTVVTIDNTATQFGKITITDTNTTVSELMLDILNQMGANIDPDSATNLLMGIVAATNNFTNANPATFETVATLMRSGARMMAPPPSTGPMPNFNKPVQQPNSRPQPMSRPQTQNNSTPRPAWNNQQSQTAQRQPMTNNTQPRQQQQTPPIRKPFNPPAMPASQPSHQSHAPTNMPNHSSQASQSPASHDAPPDWLKPKIFKGSTHN